MRYPSAPPQLGPILALAVALTFMLGLDLRRGANTEAAGVFQSPVQPTATRTRTPAATRTRTRTPTAAVLSGAGAVIVPSATPMPAPQASGALTRRVFMPLIAKPLRYGWKGVADAGELTSATKANGFWGLNPGWYYNWGYDGPWAAAHAAGAAAHGHR